MNRKRRAFTIVELLVVIAIIALLVSILLPAIGKARDQAKLTQSMANLRNMGAGSDSYAAEWNDRQFTLIEDNIAQYAGNADQAFPAYRTAHNGINHQGVILGWGYVRAGFPQRQLVSTCISNGRLTVVTLKPEAWCSPSSFRGAAFILVNTLVHFV